MRRSTLDEAPHALHEVGRPVGRHHHLQRPAQRLVQADLEVAVDLVPDGRQGGRCTVTGQVARVCLGLREYVVALDHPADQPQPEGFVRVEGPGRQQEVKGVLQPDIPRQDPAQAVLGREPTTGERGGELRTPGGEADVAHERLDEPDAGAPTVDGGDQWLAQGPRPVLRRSSRQVEPLAGLLVEAARVHPGAEGRARAGQDDRADIGVPVHPVQRPEIGRFQVW